MATRQAILDAASQVFAREGLSKARMEDIASSVGVAVGTLYNHFNDRADLVEALREASRGELAEKLDAALAAHKGEPARQRIEAFVQVALDHFESRRSLYVLVLEEEAQRGRPMKGPPLVHEIASRAEKLARQAIKEGALRAEGGDPEFYALLLAGMLRAVSRRAVQEQRPLAADAPRVVRFFFEGCGAR